MGRHVSNHTVSVKVNLDFTQNYITTSDQCYSVRPPFYVCLLFIECRRFCLFNEHELFEKFLVEYHLYMISPLS